MTANLAGNIGTPDFDVFPGRLCGQQISERLLGNSWIMDLGNYKGGIMVDPNKARLKSCKDTVVLSTARKYVSKAKNFQDFCMKRKRLPKGAKSAIKKWKPLFSLFEKLFIVQYCNVNYFFEFLIENTYLLKID